MKKTFLSSFLFTLVILGVSTASYSEYLTKTVHADVLSAVVWPCDASLTDDLSCAPNSLLMTCLQASPAKMIQDPRGTADLCYEKYDANERDKAGKVADSIVNALQDGTNKEQLPCTKDASTCKELYACINSPDRINSPGAKLACYDSVGDKSDLAAAQKILGEITTVTKPAPQAAVTPQTNTSQASTLKYTPLESLPGLENASNISFAQMLSALFKILITIAALLAVATLVWGGVMYMTSEAFETKGEAKKRMQAAIFALLLVAGSWLLLYTINPRLIEFNLQIANLENGTAKQPSASQPAAHSTTQSGNQLIKQCRADHMTPYNKPDGSIGCK